MKSKYFTIQKIFLGLFGLFSFYKLCSYTLEVAASLSSQGLPTKFFIFFFIILTVTTLIIYPIIGCFYGFIISLKINTAEIKRKDYFMPYVWGILGYVFSQYFVSIYFSLGVLIYKKIFN
jgi:hypothetical protein